MNLKLTISSAFPLGISYEDAAILCLRLFCTVDGDPEELHRECNKDDLAIVFSELYREGVIVGPTYGSVLYGANYHSCNDKGHWIEILASIFKLNMSYDRVRAQELIGIFKRSDVGGCV